MTDQRLTPVLFSSFLAGTIAMLSLPSGAQQLEQQLLVGPADGPLSDQLLQMRDSLGATEIRRFPGANTELWSLPSATAADVLSTLDVAPGVTLSEVPGDYRSLFSQTEDAPLFSAAQEDYLANIEAANPQSNVTIVQLAPSVIATHALTEGFDVRDGFDQPGSIRLRLTDEMEITAVQTSTKIGETGFVWTGQVQDQVGDVFLVSNGQRITGTVRMGASIYSIRPLGEGLHAVVSKDVSAFPPEHPPGLESPEDDDAGNLQDLPPLRDESTGVSHEIDILVGYTQSASDNFNMQDLLSLSIETTNTSFESSGISSAFVSLVHSYLTDYDEAGVSFGSHIVALADTDDGDVDEIHELMDKHGADVGVLILNDGEACGEARKILADTSSAFAVVHYDCAVDNFSFAHELGHLFGARHDTFVDSNDVPFPYGHGYVHNQSWRTIMAYRNACGSCPRIGQWSNPDMEIAGAAAGTEDRENNARVVREIAQRIGSFR